jgi:hypothetical protein
MPGPKAKCVPLSKLWPNLVAGSDGIPNAQPLRATAILRAAVALTVEALFGSVRGTRNFAASCLGNGRQGLR